MSRGEEASLRESTRRWVRSIGAARHRPTAARDRGALLGPLAGAALYRPPPRLPPGRRRLPYRRPGRAPRRRRARGGQAGVDPARDERPHTRDRRGAPAAPVRHLPADGDRVRPLPAQPAAPRGRRDRERERELRARDPHGRAPARDLAPVAEAGADRGARAVTELQLDDITIPEVLPILPLKDTVVFPESMSPLAIGQERSVMLIDDVIAGDERLLALVTVKDPDVETPGFGDLYEVGTAAVIHKMIKVPDGTLRILVQGLKRIRIVEPADDDPYLVARIEEVSD